MVRPRSDLYGLECPVVLCATPGSNTAYVSTAHGVGRYRAMSVPERGEDDVGASQYWIRALVRTREGVGQ